jgi:hypothetical protein
MTMKIIILEDKLYDYAMHMMKRYSRECMEPEELRPASILWEALLDAQDLPEPKKEKPAGVGEPFTAPDGATVVPIEGPLSVEVDEQAMMALRNGLGVK